MKSPKSAASSGPNAPSEKIRRELSQLIARLEADTDRSGDPRYGALVDKATEVLKSLRLLFERFGQGTPAKRESGKSDSGDMKRDARDTSISGKAASPSTKPAASPSTKPAASTSTKPATPSPTKPAASPKEKEKPAGKTAERDLSVSSAKDPSKAARPVQAGSAKPAKPAEPAKADRSATPPRAVPDQTDSSSNPLKTGPAKVEDPDEVAAKARLQRKEARAPKMPGGPVALKAAPPQSGKPIWDKPHSA